MALSRGGVQRRRTDVRCTFSYILEYVTNHVYGVFGRGVGFLFVGCKPNISRLFTGSICAAVILSHLTGMMLQEANFETGPAKLRDKSGDIVASCHDITALESFRQLITEPDIGITYAPGVPLATLAYIVVASPGNEFIRSRIQAQSFHPEARTITRYSYGHERLPALDVARRYQRKYG